MLHLLRMIWAFALMGLGQWILVGSCAGILMATASYGGCKRGSMTALYVAEAFFVGAVLWPLVYTFAVVWVAIEAVQFFLKIRRNEKI